MNRYVLLVALSLMLFGCGNKEEAPEVKDARSQTEAAKKGQAEAEKKAAVALALQRAAEEKAAKEQAKAEEEKSSSRLVTFGLIIVALLTLFVGIAMGSSARKDASGQRKPPND